MSVMKFLSLVNHISMEKENKITSLFLNSASQGETRTKQLQYSFTMYKWKLVGFMCVAFYSWMEHLFQWFW